MASRQEAAGKLAEFIVKANELRQVPRRHMRWDLWIDEVESFLRRTLGDLAEKEFKEAMNPDVGATFGDPQPIHLQTLQIGINKLAVMRRRVIRGDYGTQLEGSPNRVQGHLATPASVFIAHSGEPPALSRLADFLKALGVEPVIAERLPFKGRQVPDQARSAMNGCAAAIVFATAADAATDRTQPGRGLLNETGVLQEQFGDKIIYLVEEGVQLGAMLDSYARESFTQECLEKAFHRIVVELKAHRII